MKCLIIACLIVVGIEASASQVRELPLKPQDVGVINTSMKFSTVIQVNEKPLNVVLGDQNNFRVEFIGNNITVKPLRSGAKTNLFIFTENDRYNLTLQSGKPDVVNYVVKLKRIYDDPSKAVELNYSVSSHGIRLTVLRKVKSSDATFLDFRIENMSGKVVEIAPDQFRFVAGGRAFHIRDLFLEKTSLKKFESAMGSLHTGPEQIRRPFSIWIGLKAENPISFSFRTAETAGKVALHAAF